MSISPFGKSRADAATLARSTRAGLLASACFAATNLVLANSALANSATIGGVADPFANLFVPAYMYESSLVTGAPGVIVVKVDTTALNGSSAVATVGVNANSAITVNVSQNVNNPFALPGIWMANNGFMSNTDAMTASVTGGATVSSAGSYGILAGASAYPAFSANGPISITSDGTGMVKGAYTGIAANTLLTQKGLVKVDGFKSIDSSAGNGVWVAQWGLDPTSGIQVTNNGPITAATEGVLTAAVNGNTVIDTTKGKVTAGGDGIAHSWGGYTAGNTGTGALSIKTADVQAGAVGVFGYTLSGNNAIDTTAGTITAGTNGVAAWNAGTILTPNTGTVDIKTADVNAKGTGVWSRAWDGATTVDTTAGTVTAGLDGVIHASLGYLPGSNAGPVTIKTADVTAGAVGVFSYTITGNNAVDTTAGTIDAGTNGIAAWVFAGPGTVDVKTADVNAAGYGVWTRAVEGNTTVDTTAGTITATEGIVHASLGFLPGSTTGDVTITTANINATDYGVFSYAGAGTNTVNVTAGSTVTGGFRGVQAATLTGDTIVNVAAGATVQGLNNGVVTGVLPGAGVATTNNLGTIKNTADTGAANTNGGFAYYAFNGDNVLNNDAQVIGGIFTNIAGSAIINNNAAGVWKPIANVAVNAFALTDTVNNAGLIDVRTGRTTFNALGAFNNLAGGVIDMTYGGSGAIANARDSLNVLNFSPKAGSIEKFNVDFTQANSVGTEALLNDHSSNGLGTADTIVVLGKGTPQALSTVDLAIVGGAATGTSGSIALVNAVPGGLADPGLGGYATMIASTKYVLAADPSNGAVVYRLVDDKNGGVYLQWAPNLSAASLGGFGGAVGVSTASGTGGSSGGGGGGAGPGGGGGGGGMSKGGAIATASGSMNGAGGLGLSGGPSGGGAAGQVGDMAAGSAMSFDTGDYGGGGSLKDGGGYSAPACPSDGRGSAWAAGDVSRSNSTGGGDGRSDSLAGGVEANVGDAAGLGCRRLALGVFGFAGDSVNSWGSGRDKSSNDGVGAYIRASSAMGLYGSLLGAISWSDHDLTNNVMGSTANKNATGVSGVATVGYVTHIAATAFADLRTYVAYGNVDGDAFTASNGITISGTNDDIVTVGASAGLYALIAPSTQGFVRGGVKWAQVDSSITSSGVTVSGSAEEASGSVESGFVARTAEGVEFGASGFGEFSDSTTSYGGRAHVGVKF